MISHRPDVLTTIVLLAIFAALPMRPVAASTELSVFLFAGQSNMAGADSVVPEPPGFRQQDADRATLFTTAPMPAGQRAREYFPWAGIRGYHGPGGKLVHGPEVGFARSLYAAGWRDVAIIKVYGNFTRTAKGWPWAPEGALPEGALYGAWIAFNDRRLSELRARGHRYRVRGFVWHQGIDDAIHGKLAARYEQNLSHLIRALRQRYADETTPFVLARSPSSPIAESMSGRGPSAPMAVVRAAQVAVGTSVPHAGWIDTDDLQIVNRHHFTAAAQLAIGDRLARAFLDLARRRSPDGN